MLQMKSYSFRYSIALQHNSKNFPIKFHEYSISNRLLLTCTKILLLVTLCLKRSKILEEKSLYINILVLYKIRLIKASSP